ncbi:MAG: glycosyltransferase family 2 protein [Chloroflexi bacterium]|nr:glycosyltransferase family 2 protein [Chloroflexota bacterium]
MDRLLADGWADAIVVVDADSVADRDFLAALVQPFEAGARAVQGESLLYDDSSPGSALRVLAFLLVNRVRPTGRAVLRLSATHLAGNGMLLARDLLLAKPWSAFTSAEDLEYSLDLQLARVKIAFAPGAVLLSPTAPDPRAAAQQQLRWEGGKMHLARIWIPRLLVRAVGRRRPALLGLAFDLAMPPLGFLSAIAVTGAFISAGSALAGLLPRLAVLPWVVSLIGIALHVLVGMRAGHAPASCYRALVRAPWFVITKLMRARHVLTFSADTWVRTDRGSTAR